MNQTLDSPAFNLIDEPWIPCIRNDGSKAELNLREVLLEAQQLRGLYGETPLIVASLYRFLLAMMYSIYGNPSTRSWKKLWEAKHNDAERVEEYLKKWHERFYLFHPERPFYQWADGATREKT
ncbi:MAG: type I-E CRISPR-associated protein Cse1/CasA, partial [Chloroflexi bacterium]